jgi:ADP-ribose pyrophosphatase YjhB (NUDIX family)
MDLMGLLDQVRIIARNGLHYTQDVYDRERYERLLNLTAETYEEQLGLPAAEVRERFLSELGHITPKMGADAAIFNEQGEILLMERADGTGWCLPCGWVEPGEQPSQAAVREAREETGLEIKVRQLVGVFTRPASRENGPHHMVAVVHLCDVIGGELKLSFEGLALRYWPLDEVPRWHTNQGYYAHAAYELWKSGGALPARSE